MSKKLKKSDTMVHITETTRTISYKAVETEKPIAKEAKQIKRLAKPATTSQIKKPSSKMVQKAKSSRQSQQTNVEV